MHGAISCYLMYLWGGTEGVNKNLMGVVKNLYFINYFITTH